MALPPTPEGYDNWNDYIETESPALATAQSITLQEAKASIKLLEVAKPIRSEVGEPYFRQYNVFTTWADRAVLPALGRPWLESTPVPAIVTRDLQLYLNAADTDSYPGTGTTWTDLSTNEYTATLIDAPVFNTTHFTFDGVNDYANTNQSLAAEEFSLGVWFRTEASGINMMLSKETTAGRPWNYRLWLNGGQLRADIALSGSGADNIQELLFDGGYNDGEWYFAMVTRNNDEWYLYVNGAEVATRTDTFAGTISNSQELWIGRSAFTSGGTNPTGSYPYDGDIGQVFVYDAVLTPAEVLQNYNATRTTYETTPAPEPGAVLVMSLDADGYSGSGDWLDSTDNGNDAVLEGTPAYSATAPKFFDLVPAEGDFFTVADSATLDTMTEVSFEMWINIDSIVAGPNMLFSKRGTVSDGYVGFFTTTGWTFRFGTGVGTGLTYGTAPATGVWQQVVATIGSAGSKLYINGVEVAAGAYTGDSNNVNTSAALDLFEVNPRPQMGPVRMDGKVAVFNIYNGVLSDTDVGTAFDTAKARFGL